MDFYLFGFSVSKYVNILGVQFRNDSLGRDQKCLSVFPKVNGDVGECSGKDTSVRVGSNGLEAERTGVRIDLGFSGNDRGPIVPVIAIQAALMHARATGEGQHIDMALLDSQAAVLANQNLNFLISGASPIVDLWPLPSTSAFELKPGQVPVPVGHPDFYDRYRDVGDVPGTKGDAKKEIFTRLLKALGREATPLL